MDKRHRHNSGFTIVELGIALVVLGLIVSSLLVGQELIKAAKIRNIINQLNSYDTAASTFHLKYGGIPGDFRKAEAYGLGSEECTDGDPDTIIGCNGNGDNRIGRRPSTIFTTDEDIEAEDVEAVWAGDGEHANFWYHLARAGLVTGNYDGDPRLVSSVPRTGLRNVFILTSSVMVNTAADDYIYANSYLLGLNRVDWDYTNLEDVDSRAGPAKLLPEEAYTLDLKLDDGMALNGKVRNFESFARFCHIDGIYRIGNEAAGCALTINMRGAAAEVARTYN